MNPIMFCPPPFSWYKPCKYTLVISNRLCPVYVGVFACCLSAFTRPDIKSDHFLCSPISRTRTLISTLRGLLSFRHTIDIRFRSIFTSRSFDSHRRSQLKFALNIYRNFPCLDCYSIFFTSFATCRIIIALFFYKVLRLKRPIWFFLKFSFVNLIALYSSLL
jgi:hypothetical protein